MARYSPVEKLLMCLNKGDKMKIKSLIMCGMAISVLFASTSALCETSVSTDLSDQISIEVLPGVSEETDNNEDVVNNDLMTDETPEPETEEETVDEVEVYEDLNQDEVDLLSVTTPEGDKWETSTRMTEKRADCDFKIINGELYAIGGMNESGYIGTIEKYSSTAEKWQYVTDIPSPSKGYSVASYADEIYIIGGYRDGHFLSEVKKYNVVNDEWSDVTPMTNKRDQAASAVINNKIYMFGGRDENGFVTSYEYYDMNSNSWLTSSTNFDRSIIRVGAEAQYLNGRLFVIGGINMDYEYAGADSYLASDLEIREEILSAGYEDVTAAWGEDKGLIFVSSEDDGYSDVVEVSVVNEELYINSPVFVNTVPSGKYSRCVIYDGYLYSIGGYKMSAKSYMNNVYRYSVYYGDYSSDDGDISNTVTQAGNSITLNVEAGREYMIFINAKQVNSYSDYEFKLEYSADAFAVVDGCALTANEDVYTGAVTGTDIEITECDSAGLSFICNEQAIDNSIAPKSVNAVILRANSSGKRTITYSMIKKGD